MNDTLKRLEVRLTEYIGAKYSVVTSSGRMALEITLKALDINGPVIIPNLACSIVPVTALKIGARPIIGEIKEDLSLNLRSIQEFSNDSDSPGALMPIYFYGCPTDDPNEILDYSRNRDLFLIEDVAQSLGAVHESKKMGSYGDAGIFSFPKVFFDLFRGGAITTNDSKTAEKARCLRDDLQRECSASTLSMISRRYQFKGKLKGKIERLTSRVLNTRERKKPQEKGIINTLKPPYQIYDDPYFYEHLTELETNKALQTLNEIDDLRSKRLKLTKRIMENVKKHEEMELLHHYNKDFVYTRVPVLLKNKHLAHWISFLQGRGINIDMVYAPLSMSKIFRKKCTFFGNYETSISMSHKILPLPVTESVADLLD